MPKQIAFKKSAEPFSQYSTLKIKTWTVLQEKNDRKQKMLFSRGFVETEKQYIV